VSYAIDSNVLLRSVEKDHPKRDEARASINKLLLAGEEVFLLPQNLVEFWVVATRPREENGLGLSASDTAEHIAAFEAIIPVYEDTPAIYEKWKRLITQHVVMGKNAHDARIAATLTVHGITHLVTFNKRHFKRFPAFTSLLPSEV